MREEKLGVSADAMFTSPMPVAATPASGGSQAARRCSRSGRGARCTPRRQAVLSRVCGKRSCQSFHTSQAPTSRSGAAARTGSPTPQREQERDRGQQRDPGMAFVHSAPQHVEARAERMAFDLQQVKTPALDRSSARDLKRA